MPIFFIIIFAVYVLGNIYIFFRGWPVIASLHKGRSNYLCLLANGLYLPYLGYFFWEMCRFLLYYAWITPGGNRVAGLPCTWWWFTGCWYPPSFQRENQYSFIYATGRLLCVLIYGNYRYQHPETGTSALVINKPLKGYQHSVKVVAVSDIHLGYGTSKDQLKSMAERSTIKNPITYFNRWRLDRQ